MISSEALTSLIQLHVGIKSDRRKEEKEKARKIIYIDFVRFDRRGNIST